MISNKGISNGEIPTSQDERKSMPNLVVYALAVDVTFNTWRPPGIAF